jgi:hypothetical protein
MTVFRSLPGTDPSREIRRRCAVPISQGYRTTIGGCSGERMNSLADSYEIRRYRTANRCAYMNSETNSVANANEHG